MGRQMSIVHATDHRQIRLNGPFDALLDLIATTVFFRLVLQRATAIFSAPSERRSPGPTASRSQFLTLYQCCGSE